MSTWIESLLLTVVSVGMPVSIMACAAGHPGVNSLLGIRTRYVMADQTTWRVGHRAAVPASIIGGAIALVLSVISFDPQLPAVAHIYLILGAAAALLVGVIVGSVVAGRAALDHLERSNRQR